MAKEPGYGRDDGDSEGRPQGASQHHEHSLMQEDTGTLADSAMGAAESAKTAATDQIQQHKQAAQQSLDAFAQAVRKASDELSSQDQTAAAQLIQEAASGLESLSRTLSSQSLSDMVGTVREFGRRNPAALAGGAALVGLALGRFARSSSEPSENALTSSTSSPSNSERSQPTGASPMTRGGHRLDKASDYSASRAAIARPSAASSPSQSGAQSSSPTRSSTPRDGGNKRSGGSHE